MKNKCMCYVLILAACLTSLAIAEDQVCQIEWRVDWSAEQPIVGDTRPFETPGEIFNGVTPTELIEALGLAWNAPSWQVIAGLVCVRFGPLLNSLVDDNSVRNECDEITSALRDCRRWNVELPCRRLWVETGVAEATEDTLGIVDTGFPISNGMETIEKLSPITFEVLEWLGPSPFSLDVFGGCSALRIFLSMQINDIVDRIKTILAYPVSFLFEEFQLENACDNAMPQTDNYFYIAIIDALSDPSDLDFCRFLSRIPTMEEYFDRATSVIDNTFSILTDVSICGRLLTAYAQLFGEGSRETFTLITGADLDSFNSREALCTDLSIAFDSRSSFVPPSYSVPFGQDLETWDFNSESGELLPGFSFQDAANVVGAFLRSGTLAEGLTLICSVFESFIVDNFPDGAGNVTEICATLRLMNLERLEKKCLEMSVPLQYGDLPISVRIPTAAYMAVTGFEFARVLLGLDKISASEVCEDLDEFLNSDNNLQTVVRLAVDTYLTEILPIVHNICEDYDNAYRYFVQGSDRSPDAVTVERFVRAFILAHLGYPTRQQLCDEIASGIDRSSGRATPQLVELFQTNLLIFIEDEERCVASADALLTAIVHTSDVNLDEESFLMEYFGFASTRDACSELNTFFRVTLCSENDDDDGDDIDNGNENDSAGSTLQKGNMFLICILMVIAWSRFHDI